MNISLFLVIIIIILNPVDLDGGDVYRVESSRSWTDAGSSAENPR